jgi:hypothetical protein
MSESDRFYKKAIDILMSDNLNYKELIVRLAKDNPELFIDLVQINRAPVDHDIRSILGNLLSGNRIEAIKLTRTKFSLELKEAKDVINNLCDNLSQKTTLIRPYSTASYQSPPLYDNLNDIHEEIYVARHCVGIE